MISFRGCVLALFGIAIQTLPASSQSLSAADILAQVDQKVGGLNEFQQLLNDPDPARSMAAMQIMLGSGDVELERMALDYGIYSPNPIVQRTALEAFFDTHPVLNAYFKQAEGEKNGDFAYYASDASGSVLNDGRAYIPYKIGKYDVDKMCWVKAQKASDCRIRISDEGVSLAIWEKWHALSLNEQGQLVGSGGFPNSNKPVTTEIQIGK
jgi:hypothetical protein